MRGNEKLLRTRAMDLFQVVVLVTLMTTSLSAEEDCPCILYPDVKDTYRCSDPSLTSVPACVPDTTIYLEISSPIPLVPDSISRFVNLTELHVMYRDVGHVATDIVWFNGNLIVLEFFSTGLEFVDKDWFLRAPQILAVSFDYNKLAALPDDAFSFLPRMTNVFLRNNKLTTLSPALFQNSPLLSHVYLTNNPWHCDCRLATFVQWTRDRNVVMAGSPSCSTPADLRGVYLKDLSSDQLCP